MESQSDYSTRGCLLGKTVSPRLQQLEDDFIDNGGRFKEYKIKDLFSALKVSSKLSKLDVSDEFTFPVYSSDTSNGGIYGYSNSPEFIVDDENNCYLVFGDHTRTFNIARQSFAVMDNVKVLKPFSKYWSDESLLYVATIWKKQIPNYGYSRHWKYAKSCLLKLPIHNGELAFDYMESYIRELEQERIRELEQERIRELDAYLKATGLNDYELTPEEKNSIEIMSKGGLNYKEFKVLDIFTVKNTQSVMKSQVDFCSGDIPYVTAGETNNSIASYISAEPSIIDKGNCIVIGGKSTVVTYQEQDFVSNDSHNLALYMKETDKKSKYTQMFFVTLLSFKLKQLYNWGNSISNKKIQKDTIHVPVNQNGDIDYQFIELYSKAVEKLCIKSVVDWKDRIIQTTKNVVNC